jgi:DNA-binding MurR/RpiR family transcriptional regulator
MTISEPKKRQKRNGAEVQSAIRASLGRLAPAERRVAEVALRDPEALAFGTVASVAAAAGTSGPSVVRLAARLGYPGFVGLQQAVRRDLRERLRPAVERIRSASEVRGNVLARALEVEIANVRASLEAIDPPMFERAVDRLAEPDRRVLVIPSEQALGVGRIFAGDLSVVRDRVRMISGSEFRLVTELGSIRRGDVVVLLDLRRHERWIVEASRRIAKLGATRIALVDSELSPLADGAHAVLPIAATGTGFFDSLVGMVAVSNALVAGVATRLRTSVTRRLEALEAIWVESGALVDD